MCQDFTRLHPLTMILLADLTFALIWVCLEYLRSRMILLHKLAFVVSSTWIFMSTYLYMQWYYFFLSRTLVPNNLRWRVHVFCCIHNIVFCRCHLDFFCRGKCIRLESYASHSTSIVIITIQINCDLRCNSILIQVISTIWINSICNVWGYWEHVDASRFFVFVFMRLKR